MIDDYAATQSSKSVEQDDEHDQGEEENEPSVDPFEQQDRDLQKYQSPKNSQEMIRRSVYTSPEKQPKRKVGRKRKFEEITPDTEKVEPPTKIHGSERLQELYQKMLNSRAQSKKDEDEWRYFLHQMYYTRDPDVKKPE